MTKLIPGYYSQIRPRLVQLREIYQKRVQMLGEEIARGVTPSVGLEDVDRLRDELFGLKHCGGQFRQMASVQSEGEQEQLRHLDKLALDLS